jgi:hypothetical protein
MTPTQAGPVAVDSSLLASVTYDGSESFLQLEFRDGAIYRYFAVPFAVYDDLLAADSKGSYFNRRIRGRFRHLLLRRPQ